jgi:hypothetical protein
LLKVNRYLVKEGALKEFTSKGTRKIMFYLLNDVLITAIQDVWPRGYRFRSEIALDGCWVEEHPSVDTPVFYFVALYDTLAVTCSSRKEMEEWIMTLNSTIDAHEKIKATTSMFLEPEQVSERERERERVCVCVCVLANH